MQVSRLAHTTALQLTLRRWLSSLPDHTKITMPKVSPTMTAGRLISWKKQEGEPIAEGEDIVDIESDKATMPIEARDDGFMAKIFVQDDTADIPLGRLLAIVVEEEEHINAFKDFEEETEPKPVATPQSQTTSTPILRNESNSPATVNRKYDGPIGPAVMRLLNQYKNLNLDAVTPTGPKGRILKGDVLAAIESGVALNTTSTPTPTFTNTTEKNPASPSTSTSSETTEGRERAKYTDIPITSMRRAIAKRLNKTSVPHQYASIRYNLDNISNFRKLVNTAGDAKVSVNDIVIKAVSVALNRVPEMNVRLDATTNSLIQNNSVDISMAVAIEGGLITPIVSNADRRGLKDIAKVTKDLTAKAKEGTLTPEEFEGGCFSVSNLGMLGISHFSAIINPPQSGILAVGAPLKLVRGDDDGNMVKVTEGIATLSSDARVISEETAAQFLKEFSSCMSDPQSMII